MKKLSYKDPRFFARLERFASDEAVQVSVRETVTGILREVQARGDRAILDYTEKFDGFRSTA